MLQKKEKAVVGKTKTEIYSDKKLKALKRLPLASHLNAQELQLLSSLLKEKSYRKDEVIFFEDTYGEEVYLIVKGEVKISTMSLTHKKTTILGILKSGDFLGEMAIIEGEDRSATATAFEDTDILIITKKGFLQFLKKNPQASFKIMRSLCSRLREANEKIKSMTFYDLPGRLARILLSLYNTFPGEVEGSAVINIPLTHKDLADMLGTARESVTKIISTFRKDGAINSKGKTIFITDKMKLESWIR